MDVPFGVLRAASVAIRKGVDLLTDDQKRAVLAAASHTADEHAADYEEYLQTLDSTPEDVDIPDPFDPPASREEPESDAELLVVELLLNATGHEAVGCELDELEGKGDALSEETFVDALTDHAPADLHLDFAVVTEDFLDYLERELGAISDDAQAKVQIRNQQRIIDLLQGDQQVEAREALAEQGFEMLEPSDLHDDLYNADLCWRRSFTFTEVYDDIPIERERPAGERTKVADGLMDDLEGGDSVVLLGEPGAGKTTICKNVACRWYDREDTGTVLYRSHKKDAPVTDPDELVDAIRDLTGDGPVLVHVEDAARHDSVAVFEAIRELQGDADVSFLLNSREREWERLADVGGEQGVFDLSEERGSHALSTAGTVVERKYVPRLDEREIERILKQFACVTGKSVSADPAELVEQISTEEGASPMLLLSYYLPIGDVGEPDGDSDSALHHNVEKAYDRITGPDEDAFGVESEADRDLLEDVALLVNVLNAAGIEVYEWFAYALADSDDGHEFVAELFERLQGVLLFGERGELRHWSHHEYWSEVYLQEHLDRAGSETAARSTFDRCVNALFEVVKSEEIRNEIQRRHGTEISRFESLEKAPTEQADSFTEAIFNIGVARPSLAELYGDSEYSGIRLPELLSPEIKVMCAYWRFDMWHMRGRHEKAETELDAFRDRADSTGMKNGEPIYRNRKGRLAETQGDFECARGYYEQALEIDKRLGDDLGIASALGGLGSVALREGHLDTAREHYEKSREHLEKIEHQQGKAAVLDNLGLVAFGQDDYEAARDFHEQSLKIAVEIGDRTGVADSLGNLGNVAIKQGDFKAAREYHMQSLSIERDMGNRTGAARSLANLGNVALKQNEYREARKYHEKSLAEKRDVGDLEGAANTLANLGSIALEQGDYETARDNYKQANVIFEKLGAVRRKVKTSKGLIRVFIELGDLEHALEWYEEAFAVIEASDVDLSKEFQQLELLHKRLVDFKNSADLYRHSLLQILQTKPRIALRLLQQVWDQQTNVEPGSEKHRKVLGAGVGVAALAEMFDIADSDIGVTDVLEEIEPHQEDLSQPAAALYKQLSGDPSTSPNDLRERADVDPDVGEPDLSKVPVEDLEATAYAILIDRLQFDTDIEQRDARVLYRGGLAAIASDNLDYATRYLREAWDRHDDVIEEDKSYPEVYAAGVALAAHLSLLDEADDEEIDDILPEVELAEDDLPEPAYMVLSALRGEESDVTPDDLAGDAEFDAEDPDMENLEAAVFVRLFRILNLEATLADAKVDKLYEWALVAIPDENPENSIRYLALAWERGQEGDNDDIPTEALRAGVGLAAHLRMLEPDEDAADEDEILKTVKPKRDRLSPAVEAVFEHLHEGATDESPAELSERVDAESMDDIDRDGLETVVFAGLLQALIYRADKEDTDLEAVDPSTSTTTTTVDTDTYADGLEAILDDDPTSAVDALLDVWYQHDDVDRKSAGFATTLAAGVLFAALTEGDTVVAGVRENALDAAGTDRDRLSAPVDAVYAHLTDGDGSTTPEDVRAMAAEDDEATSEKPDLESLEAEASAHLLADLRF